MHRYPINEPLLYGSSLRCSTNLTYLPTPDAQQEHILPQEETGIVDPGETHLYIALSPPHGPPDTSASTISEGTANGQVENSSEKATLPIPKLAVDFPTTGYIMPSFTNTLVGVGPICDAHCTVIFTKQDVTVLLTKCKAILIGWRDKKLPRIWRLALKPTEELINNHVTTRTKNSRSAQCLRPTKRRSTSAIHACTFRSYQSTNHPHTSLHTYEKTYQKIHEKISTSHQMANQDLRADRKSA